MMFTEQKGSISTDRGGGGRQVTQTVKIHVEDVVDEWTGEALDSALSGATASTIVY